jgi:gluconolactonase
MTPLVPIERFEIFASGLDHPECIAFDDDGNLWAGGEAGQVYRIDPKGNSAQVADLGSFNAGLAFAPNGDLIVCNPARGVVRVDPGTGKHELLASHACGEKVTCANYPLFDKRGQLYVTDSGHWMKHNGRVICFAPDGSATAVVTPFGYANGLALDATRERLFIVESDTNTIFSLDLNPLGRPIVFATGVGRMPDGLALDDGGNLYVACYASDDIWRISTVGEKQLLAHDPWAIRLSRPTNMAFRDGMIYVANLGRQAITRAKL